MERIIKKFISILPIGVAVGVMTFITAAVCIYADWTIWLSFLAWALYFLHGGNAKQGTAAFAAFIYGIILASGALVYISYLTEILGAGYQYFIVPSSVFLVAFVITLTMRLRDDWASFIPAVYIGTVFRFAFIDLSTLNPQLTSFIYDLAGPIAFGLFIGWCTISLLTWLDKIGLSKWHVRWEVESKRRKSLKKAK